MEKVMGIKRNNISMTRGETIINKVIKYFEKIRKQYPEITDEMLVDNGAIYYMNGNDGTEFDWTANNRCCEFYMFYKSSEMGFIKVLVCDDDTLDGYVYLNEGMADGIELPTEFLFGEDALYFASLLQLEADDMGIYDEKIDKINFDRELRSWEYLSSGEYDDDDE